MRLRILLLAFVAVFGADRAFGQVVAPPPPAKYHVDLRYRIQADRDGRVRLFRAMMADLQALGFVQETREDSDLDHLNPNADRLAGVIGSDKLDKLMAVGGVQTVLVRPENLSIPEDIAKPVEVSLKLAAGLDPATQRLLFDQVVWQLEKLGFVQAAGYDDRGFTRIRGTVPAGQVMNLLKDLRGLPAGLMLQALPREKLPTPLSGLLPIRVVEVMPSSEPVALNRLAPGTSPKFSSDLRAALADAAFRGKPMRVEAALDGSIPDQKAYRFALQTRAGGVLLEGIAGSIVTLYVPSVTQLDMIAARSEVLAIRLPAKATNTVRPLAGPADALASTHIIDLQNKGYRGQGKKIVVLAGGFQREKLSPVAQYFDLTAELSPTFEPTPVNPAFDGTLAALAAQKAAPDATLILVRIDPTAFHQLHTVARAALGDLMLSPSQVARAELLLIEYDDLTRRREFLAKEYTEAFNNLSDDEKPAARRKKVQEDMAAFKLEEEAFRGRYEQLDVLRRGLESVNGATAIVNTLVWDDGYPADGLSDFAQFLDEKYVPGVKRGAKHLLPSWVQAASESTWSVRSGPALDREGNRTLNFAGTGTPLPKGTWGRELNFLAQLDDDGQVLPELPAGTKVRIAIQWREPHDPGMPMTAEPLVDFTLELLRQYDPTGTKSATDEFATVGFSEGKVVRLMSTASAGVYEQTLEVTLPSAGRYALRVLTTQHASRFGAETRLLEVTPRITVRPMDDSGKRIIFSTFSATRPGVGVPADAGGAFTVGRCDAQGRSLSLLGAGPGVQLRNKPDVLLRGDGSGAAAGTMAGLAASLADLGIRPALLVGTTAIQPNGTLQLPPNWIDSLPKK